MKYKLFVSDYDGTMGDKDFISPETVKAIKDYKAAGGKFVVCTGRMFSSISRILRDYGINGAVISYQGAIMDDLDTGRRIFSGGIDYALAAEVTETLKKEGLDVAVDIGDTRVYERRSEFIEIYENVTKTNGKRVDDMQKEILRAKVAVPKITVIAEPEKIVKLTEKYSRIYGDRLIVNNGAETLAEFVSPLYSKGRAVERAAEYYKIPLSETIAVGDSTNDIELVSGEWLGVAVGDAKEKLKLAADEITVPFNENPVKHLIEKYCKD